MKRRWLLYGIAFLGFLSVIFVTTQAITRWVIGSRVEAAAPPAVVWVAPTPSPPATQQVEQLLALSETTIDVPPSGPTAPPLINQVIEATPAALEITTIAAQATLDPNLPKQGGNCISGSIIDGVHQLHAANLTVTVQFSGSLVNQQTKQTTDSLFRFDNLTAGEWIVTLTLPDAYSKVTPIKFKVTLTGEDTGQCAEVRFKINPPTCVDVIKEDDKGIGLPGWVFTTTMGTNVITRTTDWQGRAHFEKLKLGEWQFEEKPFVSKANVIWRPRDGEDSIKRLNLEPTKNPNECQELRFVNTQVHDSCIVAQKLNAINNRPMPGVAIRLTHNAGTSPPREQQTGADGRTAFLNVPLGTYTVEETVPPGWLPAPNSPIRVTVALTQPSTICQLITFRNEPTTCISGQKITHNYQGVSGWIITATHQSRSLTRTTTTQADGSFIFDDLPLGKWLLWEEERPNWNPVTPAHIAVEANEPRSSEQCFKVRFKNEPPPPCLEVYKLDAFDNAGLPGWTITLKPAYGGQPQTKSTDGIGYVRFDSLTPGEYIVSETEKPGWVPITSISHTITLTATGVCGEVVFKNCQTNFAQDGRCVSGSPR